jgi:hypothetical protein
MTRELSAADHLASRAVPQDYDSDITMVDSSLSDDFIFLKS